MTIASEITRINNNIANAYTACNGKGATMPVTQNSANLATCIDSIQAGGGSSKYGATVDSMLGDVDVNGVLQFPTSQANLVFTGVEDIDDYALDYSFCNRTNIVSVSFPDLVGISGQTAMGHTFYNIQYKNDSLTTVSFPELTDISGASAMYGTFYNRCNLTSISFPNLTTIGGASAMYQAFARTATITSENDHLTSISFPELTDISGKLGMYQAFSYCRSLTSISFPKLTHLSANSALYYTFQYCISLTTVSFPELIDIDGDQAMGHTFYNISGLTTISFPNLTTISGSGAMDQAFSLCGSLASIDFQNLTTIGVNSSEGNSSHFSSAFHNCRNLTSLTFPKLEKIYCTGGTSTDSGTFANNNKVEKMYFPKLDTITYGTGASTLNQNACKNIFYGCSALTELHFGAANQAAIEASPGYSTAWGRGAGNVTIYFDL